jgi:hypothetical protein
LQCKFRKLFIFSKIIAAKERKERIDKNLDCLLRLFVFFVVFRVLLRPFHLWLRLAAPGLCATIFIRFPRLASAVQEAR